VSATDGIRAPTVAGALAAPDRVTGGRRPTWRGLLLTYGLAGGWVAAMLVLGRLAPDQYRALLQEDQAVEWATAWLFLAAGVLRLTPAIRWRRLGDGLLGLFCLLVAGEEISWGQRLFGLGAPDFVLANNYQQEMTFHNLFQDIVQPKWFLILALVGYGALLPFVARSERGRGWLARLGVTAPPLALTPAFVGAAALLVWYPHTFTGEWVEALAGALFLAALPLAPTAFGLALALAVVAGLGMAAGVQAAGAGQEADRAACAAAEVRGLVDDLAAGAAATADLRQMRSVHKRVWTAEADGYLDRIETPGFDGAACAGAPAADAERRRRYGIDPWGTSYWLSVQRIDRDHQRVVVYSFGPNRRRDGTAQEPADDDIGAIGTLRIAEAP
jgi:hypothetical protein